MAERRSWKQMTPWERAVRAYLVAQAVLAIGGVIFVTSGYGWETPDKKFAVVNTKISAAELRLAAVEQGRAADALLIQGLAKLACNKDWNQARLVLPCPELLGGPPASSP